MDPESSNDVPDPAPVTPVKRGRKRRFTIGVWMVLTNFFLLIFAIYASLSLTERALPAPQWVNEMQKQYTTNLTTGTAIVGDFSQVLVGSRMNGMRLEVLDAGTGLNSDSDTLNAVTHAGPSSGLFGAR